MSAGTYYNHPDSRADMLVTTTLNELSFNAFSSEELKEIFSSDDKIDDMIKDCKVVKDLEAEKEMLTVSNRSLAEFNLSKESQLNDGKQQLKELTEQGEKLLLSIKEKRDEIKSHKNNLSAETVLALLQTAAAEIEEESEEVASKLMKGEFDVDEFLKQFAPRRTLMHLRRVKADKMTEMLTKRNSFSRVPERPMPPKAQPNFAPYFIPSPIPSGVSSTPYPVSVNMPMPGVLQPNHFA
nr:PREDICTED: vacuolar protein sorting-associated protein 37B [Bemisia tabaci]